LPAPNFFQSKIFLFCLPANAGIAETLSHPILPSAESRRAKIPSPRPPSFLPACWKPPVIFSDGGGTEREKARKVALVPHRPTRATQRNSLFDFCGQKKLNCVL